MFKMSLKEVQVTFPLKFLESLVCRNLTPKTENTRSFTATFAQKSHFSKQSYCEIVTTIYDTNIKIHLKSALIHIKNESFSCNIETWSEINNNPSKSKKNKKKGCRQIQKLKKLSVLSDRHDGTVDDINTPNFCNSISYYINRSKSLKRKLNDSDRHDGTKKKLKLTPDKQDTCDFSMPTCNVNRNKVSHESFNENESTSVMGLVADAAVNIQALSVLRKSQHSSENEGFEKSNKDESKLTDRQYFSVCEFFQNIDINMFTVNTFDASVHLKPVSLGNVDLKVCVENALIAATSVYPGNETSNSAGQIKSTLLVEETEIPLFYIHGNVSLQSSVVLGPFVLETIPVPHLRLKDDCQLCYRPPKGWNCSSGNLRVVDECKEKKGEDLLHMPLRKQLRMSTVAHRSLNGENQRDEGRDILTGHDSDVASRTTDSVFVEEDHEEERKKTEDPTSAKEENDDPVPVKKAMNVKKMKKKTIKKKYTKKNKLKVDKADKVKQGREATPQNNFDTNGMKPEGVTVNQMPVQKTSFGKPKKRKKKAALSKRGGMDAMYKRMSSYCIRIIPECGSDLWEPVSDLSQVVSTCKFCSNSSKSFPDPLILADHIRNIHKKESNYMETVRECRAKMKLKCNLCVEDRFYSRWESFGIHMRDMHSEKCDEVVNLLNCKLCNRTWVNRYKFDRHMETVHGNSERFLCHLCPQTFKWESSLRCHIKGIHDKETSHVCEICGAVFSRKEYVRVHWQKYHSEKSPGKPHRSRGIHCSICDLRLEKKKDITSHMAQVHQTDGNHASMRRCKLCQSNFASQEGLEKHTTDCHSTKQYQHCPYCGSGFQARDNMLRHIAKDHLKISPPKCPLCQKQFDYNTDLRFHLRKEHGYGDTDHTYGQADSLRSIAIIKCEYCDKPFFWVMGLINHIMLCHLDQFPYECKECGQRFKEGSSLQHHIAFRHIKASQCEEVRTLDVPVGTETEEGANSEQGRNTDKDRQELMGPTSSVGQEQATKSEVDSVDIKVKPDKTLPSTSKGPVLKTQFQSSHGGIQVTVPDIHGTFASITRKSSVPSALDRWNYSHGHWSMPTVQPHHAVPHRDYINHDAVTRAEEPVYHVLDYVRDPANSHQDLPVVRSLHPLTPVQADQVHLRPLDHATLQPEQVIGERRDVSQHLGDRGIVHVSTGNVADRNVLHASTVNPEASNASSSETPTVNASGDAGGTQLFTAENLIGLLHEFNSQQQQTNQYFSPQFF